MRSLRMKLIMIMVLLILALMTVVGSFLINGVGNFYINEFYVQMGQTFSQDFIRAASADPRPGARCANQAQGTAHVPVEPGN